MVTILNKQRIRNEAREALKAELSEFAVSDLEHVFHKEHKGRILVLAHVDGPKELSPRQVEKVQDRLSDIVGKPVLLYIRTNIMHNVSAAGAIGQSVVETLDGFYPPEEPSKEVKELRLAEQVIREYLDMVLGVHLVWLDSIPVNNRPVMVATLQGIRRLSDQEITQLEVALRERTNNPDIFLLVHQYETTLDTGFGGFRAELFDLDNRTKERKKLEHHFGRAAEEWFKERYFWIDSWTLAEIEGSYIILFEIHGPKAFEQQHLDELHQELVSEIGVPVKVYVKSRIESVLGTDTPVPFKELLHQLYQRNRSESQKSFFEALSRTK